jgi:hypothetical protein
MACQAPTNHLEERKLRPKQSSGLFFIFLVAPPNRGTRQACFWAGRRRAPVVLPKLHFTALHNDVSKYGYFQPLACHHRESHMPGRASIGRGQERMEGPSIRNWSSRSTCTVAPLQLTRSTSSLASMDWERGMQSWPHRAKGRAMQRWHLFSPNARGACRGVSPWRGRLGKGKFMQESAFESLTKHGLQRTMRVSAWQLSLLGGPWM